MLKKGAPVAADPDAYVRALRGWRKDVLVGLREAVTGAAKFEQVIKWARAVMFSNGPVLLIRAEEERVLFSFWRGKRLVDIEPRLKPGGKYVLATQEFRKGDGADPVVVAKLAKAAVALNRKLGNPAVAKRD